MIELWSGIIATIAQYTSTLFYCFSIQNVSGCLPASSVLWGSNATRLGGPFPLLVDPWGKPKIQYNDDMIYRFLRLSKGTVGADFNSGGRRADVLSTDISYLH